MVSKISPRKPLGDEVYETLKAAILNNELEPGMRLIEEQLADNIGASRTPIRQAIHMLEREDLVERQGKGGFIVKPLSLEDIEEILDLRALLESFAAKLTADKITKKNLALLNQKNEAFGRAIKNNDQKRWPGLNTDFHETLYKLSANRRLIHMIHDLRDHFYRYRVALLSLQNMPQMSYSDHKEMIEAMSAGDPELTESLVRSHILKGKEIILNEVRAGRL